jgi:glycogen operon protein
MSPEDWSNFNMESIGVVLGGDAIDEIDECGKTITGDTVLMLFNFNRETAQPFTLPFYNQGKTHLWELLIDTTYEIIPPEEKQWWEAGQIYELSPMNFTLFRRG